VREVTISRGERRELFLVRWRRPIRQKRSAFSAGRVRRGPGSARASEGVLREQGVSELPGHAGLAFPPGNGGGCSRPSRHGAPGDGDRAGGDRSADTSFCRRWGRRLRFVYMRSRKSRCGGGGAQGLKLGMDTRSVIARFEADGRRSPCMEHPNIARGRRRGDETGRPYL